MPPSSPMVPSACPDGALRVLALEDWVSTASRWWLLLRLVLLLGSWRLSKSMEGKWICVGGREGG